MTVLGQADPDLYDWAEAGIDEGEVLVGSARPGYREVASELRDRIFSGRLPAGAALPGQVTLSRELGADVAVVNRAVGILAGEGLVLTEHGKPTAVLRRRPYQVTASVPWTRDGDPPAEAVRALATAVDVAAARNPAITGPAVTGGPGGAVVTMTAELPDPAHAAAQAGAVIREACQGGWELGGATVTAKPA